MIAGSPVFAVADGMGGHAGGGHASAELGRHLKALHDAPMTTLDALTGTILAVDSALAAEARRDERLAGMGTTVVALAVITHDGHDALLLVNAGDSRAYRLDGTELVQLSVDHSVVQELLDRGHIDPADVNTHPQRNIVTRALGAGTCHLDRWVIRPRPGQRFLLCSDGLTRELNDDAIAHLLETIDPQAAADELVRAALAAGGRDNVGVVVVDVLAVDDPWPGTDRLPLGAEGTHAPLDDDTVPSPGGRAAGIVDVAGQAAAPSGRA